MHGIEGAALEQRVAARRDAGEIDQHVDALGRGEEQLGAGDGRLQQAAVGADQEERQRVCVVAAEGHPEVARVGGVEHPEAVATGGDVEVRPGGEIDLRLVAQPPEHHVIGGRRVERGGVGAAVVEDQRYFRHARGQLEGSAQCGLFVVLHGEHAEEPAARLAGGRAVRMRVVPVEPGTIAHGVGVVEAAVRRDQRLAVAVVGGVHRETVPVRDCGRVDAVLECDPHARAGAGHQRGIEVIAPAEACRVRECAVAATRRRAQQQRPGGVAAAQ